MRDIAQIVQEARIISSKLIPLGKEMTDNPAVFLIGLMYTCAAINLAIRKEEVGYASVREGLHTLVNLVMDEVEPAAKQLNI